jgi:hypothetical protein
MPPPTPTSAWLARLRSVARTLLVTQRVGWLLASTLAILIIAAAADFILRTPDALRIVLWLVGLIILAVLVRRVVWPAVRFRPSLTEVALRVENSPAGRDAGLSGLLASGLELEASPAHSRLADPVIEDARRKLGTLATARLLAPTRTVRAMIWLIAAAASVAVIASIEPGLTRIGASRILWPFAGSQWPKRTGVVDITEVRVHPLGSALALRAAVTTGSGAASSTARVAANYRTIVGGSPGPLRRVLLTSQDRDVRIDPGAEHAADGTDVTTGHLFERLLEPSGLGADTASRKPGEKPRASSAAGTAAPAEMTLEYWFETEDDQTKPARVLLVEPPAVIGATAAVQLPAYAASLLDRFPELARAASGGEKGLLDLGPGSDERAAAPAVLAGSRLTVTIRLNKPVPGPTAGARTSEWLARSLGPEAADLIQQASADAAAPNHPAFSTTDGGAAWTLSWTIDQPLRLTVKATDEHGITGVEEANYRFDAVRDNPPSAVITAPTEDKAVLATAIVELAAEARDDVGLTFISLERQLARKPKGSEGAPHEPVGDPVEFARITPASAPDPAAASPDSSDTRRLLTTHSLDLSELELTPGDELWITALAADVYELNGARHETVRSGVRKLRIMSRDELVQQIWSELSSVRRTAVKIDDDQKQIARSSAKPGAEEARRNQRAQSGITERVARQSEELDRLQSRVEENGLTDQGLNDILKQARDTLAKAGEKSVEASNSLNQAEKAQSQEDAKPEDGQKERDQANESQDQVRDELGKLIDMLDQGEDTYTAKRSLEQILQEQKSIQSRTGETGRQTTGKTSDQLTPQQKQDLEQIAQDQKETADKLKDAIDKMLERERKLEKNDPAAAQQMAQAAKRGQREQAAEKMQQASKQVQQNQTNSAQQQQSQAIQSLEQMLKELDKTAQTRDEVLRRFLATLIDSLNALIAQQTARLADLDAAIPDKAFKGLDGPMARLHQTTLGVLDEAKGAPREAADALALIERAADAQSAAVVGLRDDPVNDEEVRAQEQLSLDKLNEALEAAQKIDEAAGEREQDRKRAELRQKYEEALKTQISIRESSLGLVGAEATRRNKAAARQLGADQETLRQSVEAIRADLKELREARMFDYAHTRLDDLMKSSAAALTEGSPTDDVTRRQAAAARVLTSLIDALDDRKNDDKKKFREREQPQGGGGGGGNQPLVPPAAELKLLRLLQQEAAERTREAGDAAKPDPAAVTEITQLQRDLAKQAQDLLDRLSQRGPGNKAPKPEPGTDKPADAPKEEPAPEPTPSPEPQP